MIKITHEQADTIYSILVNELRLRDDEIDRQTFIVAVTSVDDPCREYRFGGALGFGGKFRNNGNRDNTPYVDCYPEDMTPERRDAIERTNAALRALFMGADGTPAT